MSIVKRRLFPLSYEVLLQAEKDNFMELDNLKENYRIVIERRVNKKWK